MLANLDPSKIKFRKDLKNKKICGSVLVSFCEQQPVCLNLPFFVQKLGRDPSDEDCFFDLLSKFQSSRMDDQRCHLDEPQNGDNGEGAANSVPSLNEMIGWLRTVFVCLFSCWLAILKRPESI